MVIRHFQRIFGTWGVHQATYDPLRQVFDLNYAQLSLSTPVWRKGQWVRAEPHNGV